MTQSTVVQVVLGYDGSPAATAAIEVGTTLFPGARGWVTYLWTPPFADESLRRRLWLGSDRLDDFIAAIEREGQAEADRLATVGATLARAGGWDAEPFVERSLGGEGLQFTQVAEKLDADVVLVGSRGLGGARALLGSVSDMVVHYTPRPVLVAPHPLLTAERAALVDGPVLVGWDGSPGAQTALTAVDRLFPDRAVVLVAVNEPDAEAPGDRELVRLRVGRGDEASERTVADALAGYARERQAALVVVGSRGRSAIKELVLGSVAIATLRRAHRPVLVVPHPRPIGG